MINWKPIFDILPEEVSKLILSQNYDKDLQEVRLRVNRPVIIYIDKQEIITNIIPNGVTIKGILQKMSSFSIYAFEEEIRQGFITIKGGHRVGLAGNCVVSDNKVKTIKDISSINIRISREIIGCSNKIINNLFQNNEVINTIIISPPKCGKTTLIRDISRNISDNFKKKVCIIDERSEIAGCYNGVPQMNVGLRTDVLDGCPKYEGIMMAIRSMSPDVIICDEIGTYDDMHSVVMAMNCGVKMITTIHGFDVEDLYSRDVFKEIVSNKVFNRALVLSGRKGAGTIEYITDLNKKLKVWGAL